MIIKTHIPKQKYQILKCEVCDRTKRCTWHHIHHRRYGVEWIWACVFNGSEGCHERIHRDVSWAYENGYLIRHNIYQKKMKKTKKKKCTHSKSYYHAVLGFNKCQFCGIRIDIFTKGKIKKHKKVKEKI